MTGRTRLELPSKAYVPTNIIERELQADKGFFWDDFIAINLNNADKHPGWSETMAGPFMDADPWLGWGTSETRGFGVFKLTGNGTGRFNQFIKSFFIGAPGDEVIIETRIHVGTDYPVTKESFQLYNDVNNHYEMYIGAAGNVFCRCVKGGVQKFNVDCAEGPPFRNIAWHRWRIHAEHARVRFYINDVLVYTHVILADLLNDLVIMISYWFDNAAANGAGIYGDWCYGRQVFPNPRDP